MDSSTDISQLCRLCLLKDKVNTPIFEGQGDIGHVYKKISSLLPVKVAEDDKLPKSICDSCTLKLDMFYEFWQMSGQSEKKLLEWLNETEPNNINQPTETIVKQEAIDINDKLEVFMNVPTYGQDFFEETTTTVDEPQAKRPKRATAAKAAATLHETDDEDDPSETLTKMEDESEGTEGEDQESAIVNVPSTSADSQPGPSGVGKESSEAPVLRSQAKKLTTNAVRFWTCKICYEEFPLRKILEKHRKTHLNKESNSSPDIQYQYHPDLELFVCNNCSAEFDNESQVQKHVETHVKKFSCEECKEIISGPFAFSCHVRSHSIDKEFRCPLCDYVTKLRTSIMQHINIMHLQKYHFQCSTCGKQFNDAILFKEHSNEHTGLRPFICVVCNKSFHCSRYLQQHQVRLHRVTVIDGESSTQCRLCSRIFAKPETLAAHMLKHETAGQPKKKKFLCDTCGQGFSRKDKLKIHYRTHTGEKPFSCSYCGKSFIKRDYLIMHERVHNGEKPYTCEVCGRSFNQGAPLRIHMRMHTGERPYACTYCGLGHISRSALAKHIKTCITGENC